MNFLDIIIFMTIIITMVVTIKFVTDEEGAEERFVFVLIGIAIILSLVGMFFLVVDKGAGSTIGEITSVDKNFFGTTAVYVKTSETSQETYCIEDGKIVNKTQELIGKRVRIYYGERVGLYSTGKCSQAPVSKIEEVGNEKDNDKSANEG